MREEISWIQLSDIHFQTSDKIDQEGAFAAIEEDLSQLKRRGLSPDLVLVTGDLAFAGVEEDYTPVATFLVRVCRRFDLARDRVIICPGNHDCDRTQVPTLRAGWISEHRSPELTHAALLSPEGALIRSRQDAYRRFLETFYEGAPPGESDCTELHVQQEIQLEELRIAVVALNSSWLCHGGEEERGSLQAGYYAIDEMLRSWPPNGTHLTIALMHHPCDWLVPFEAEQLRSLLVRRTDVVLRGHLHLAHGAVSGSGEHRALFLAAGAVRDRGLPRYQYSVGRLIIAQREYVVEERSYDLATRTWQSREYQERFERGQGFPSLRSASDALEALGFAPGAHAHLVCILSGMKSELAMEQSNRRLFLSSELAREQPSSCAAEVMRVRALCQFYGPDFAGTILSGKRHVLSAYVDQVDVWKARDPAFAQAAHDTYIQSEQVIASDTPRDSSFRLLRLRRLVASGDQKSFCEEVTKAAAFEGDVSEFAKRVLAALPASDDLDIYDVWTSCGGNTAFAFVEYGALIERFMLKDSTRAKELLYACARAYPREAGQLNETARTLATELADAGVFSEFKRIVEGGQHG